jgi:hypothetical protein
VAYGREEENRAARARERRSGACILWMGMGDVIVLFAMVARKIRRVGGRGRKSDLSSAKSGEDP